jgi:hypothetical protein
MINPEYEYWTDGHGETKHVSELEDDHLLNIYFMLKERKEKDMQFVAIGNEARRRKLL